MTETLQDPLPPPPAQRRLSRDPDDKVVAGVCAAAGRYTDTDPVLWRVVVGALVLFGGAGIALYVLGWVLIPRTGAPSSFVERQLRRPDRSVNAVGVVLLVVLALVVLALLDDGEGAVLLLVVGGLSYLVARDRRAGAAPPVGEAAWAPTGEPSQYGVPPVQPSVAPAPPVPPRERSVLGPVTLSVAVLVTGLLLALDEAGVDGITTPRVLAAALLVVGAGLVVGTWIGRARWLIVPAVLLGLALGPAYAVEGRLQGGAGERLWVPTAVDAGTVYRLGAGEAVLDLRQLEPGSVREIDARVGLGRLEVIVPEGLSVRAVADVGVGEVIGDSGRLADDGVVVLGPGDGTVLQLDLEVGLGEIEVRRAPR